MNSKPPDSVKIPCDSGQRVHLPHIYDNFDCLASCDSSHITYMTGTTHTSIQPHQEKFYTYGVSISIDNRCYVTMSHPKKDFVRTLKIGLYFINVFEGPKVHIIYEGTISWTINNNYGHTN